MTPAETTSLVKAAASELRFDQVGIARPLPSTTAAYYRRWLETGHAGSMEYLQRNVELRVNPAQALPGARSAICVALSYHRAACETPPPEGVHTGRISRYALGADYHKVLGRMLEQLARRLRQELTRSFDYRTFVDTGPVLERELAAAAGLGWIGKNTTLLNRRLGSYVFLGEMLTTLELVPDQPVRARCGSCTRCVDACPTKALVEAYQLDASRCISYLTIEHRGEVPEALHPMVGSWVFGCDICQQVCPFNQHAPSATHPEIATDRVPEYVSLLELLNLGGGAYRRLTEGSAARRARRNMWRRNAAVALGNVPRLTAEERRALVRACEDQDATVRHAARAALNRHRRR
jgi:epoxyqueuosine reductase